MLMKDDEDNNKNGPIIVTDGISIDEFLSDLLVESPGEKSSSYDESVKSTESGTEKDIEKVCYTPEVNVDDDNDSAAIDDPVSNKKERRQLRNRDAAVRSRERKKMYVKDLEVKSKYLEGECRRLSRMIQCVVDENHALRYSLQCSNAHGAPFTKQESAVLILESGRSCGDGVLSYTQNSSFQREALQLAEVLIREAIAENLDIIPVLSSSNALNIADLGCSTGPNTFACVHNIIESVLLKYESEQEPIEFQVFFNDHIANDFNMLIKALPSDRKYFAAVVPGPFQSRLFPKASIHFFNSSYALHWLSRIPIEVVDKNSPVFNKGRIHLHNAPKAVGEAFSAQFARDMKSFLDARAEEIVGGGLIVVIIICNLDNLHSSGPVIALETCLLDMIKAGLISEAKVDSFNLPMYHPTPSELNALIEANGCFSIENMEMLGRSAEKKIYSDISRSVKIFRSIWEGILKEHFGSEIMDELFDRFSKILEKSYNPTSKDYVAEKFIVIKRNCY
ncbi:hypothetical protein ACFE04_007178 [Oxalis oulophora]